MRKVLVVEDDDAVRGMLSTALERDGFDVVAVANVREALSRIATEPFDVLLSDLHMPHAGDGLTVVSAMRHTHPQALTLVLSGYPALDEVAAVGARRREEVRRSHRLQVSLSGGKDGARTERLTRGRGALAGRRTVEPTAEFEVG
jgi:CheY-like chemotaxis protein